MSLKSKLHDLVVKIAEKDNALFNITEKKENKKHDLSSTDPTLHYPSIKAVKEGLTATETAANDYTDTEIGKVGDTTSALVDRVTTNEGDISDLQSETAEIRTDFESADETNLTAAKGYTDDEIQERIIDKRNVANGFATLNGDTKISESYLPDSIVGQVEYQGTINSVQTETLPSATEVKGHYYIIEASLTFNEIEFVTGDWLISNGTEWQKVDNTDAVTTVFGRKGSVKAQSGDYNAEKITYDGGDSSLAGNDVQAAIDELDGKVETNTSDIAENTSRISDIEDNIGGDLQDKLDKKLDKAEYDGTATTLHNSVEAINTELSTYYKVIGEDFPDYAQQLEDATPDIVIA